ncbi:tetra-peptide repeat homeobox protein 1-like isoform X2 [Solanum tuberosum]|uniref:tetra-peptide repeat homeobox protein 1-like isoform X1 n=1 Tax=Solanum tuberosum TaxID=4113 RepID=UPI000739F9D4|nr:PREDICTED: tetra-peptide repeat homeobox protein 1-like isoform X1 [Solanum tuberosum]XP_015169422.1 PREDICTED: tetra-peptide repeat homeobox protein 1-like isoform X2 [Solanum tuberosum]
MSSKMCVVFLIVLLSIITTSPLAHAQLIGTILGGLPPIVRPILGPILGQPAPPVGQLVPPVGQVPPIVPPIVPPVGGQVPPVGVGQLPIVGPILGPVVGPVLGPVVGPVLGPVLGPILGQPIRPPVGQVPPIVPPVAQVPPIVPPVGGQVVNITIVGSLSCSVPGSNAPGPGLGGVNVTIICGNTTIAQVSTNSQGIIIAAVTTTTSVLSGNTCTARIPLPIANCTLTPNTGALVAPVILVGNFIQDLAGLTFSAIFGILTSLATVTTTP